MTGQSFNAASASRDKQDLQLLEEAACDAPRLQVMKDLLAAGANLEARNERGLTPLLAAVDAQNRDAAGLLLDSGADKYARAGDAAPLFLAILHYDLDMVRLLLDKGTDPERDTFKGGLTALMWAANLKKKDIADEIATRGGDLCRKNARDGRTAIDYAENNNGRLVAQSLRRIDARRKELQAEREAEAAANLAAAVVAAEKAALEAQCRTGLATQRPVPLKRPMRFAKIRAGK